MHSDAVFTVRSLARRPGFLVPVVLTLALGIGANTALFSLVDAVLLHPLPAIAHAGEIVAIYRAAGERSPYNAISYPLFTALSERTRSLRGLAGFYITDVAAEMKGRTARLSAAAVSGNYFQLLGLRPEVGRLLTPQDDGAVGGNALLVISYRLWAGAFAGSPSVVGSSIELGGRPFTIVGVAPQGFHGVDLTSAPDLWVPLTMVTSLGADVPFPAPMQRLAFTMPVLGWVHLVGRLRAGVSRRAAAAELNAVAANVRSTLGMRVTMHGLGKVPVPLLSLVPIVRAVAIADRSTLVRFILILLGVVALTLLIACLNVANLMLVRSRERARELGVRAALGAPRSRLVGQVLLESTIMAVLGAAAGVLVASATTRVLTAFTLPGNVHLDRMRFAFNGRVFLFTASLAVATALLLGLVPAIQSSRADLRTPLSAGGLAARSGPRAALVVGQVAMSLVLLVGAALFVRSLRAGLTSDLGFEPRLLAAVTVDPELAGYVGDRAARYYDELIARASRIPGVRKAALAEHVPLATMVNMPFTGVAGSNAYAGTSLVLGSNAISPDYFRAIGVPLIAGRAFTSADREGATQVAIVNEAAAAVLSPDRPILDQEIHMGPLFDLTVVGIVRDTKYASVRDQHVPVVFLPIAQSRPSGGITVVVRADRPRSILPALRRTVASVGPDVPLHDVRVVADQIDAALMPQRFGSTLLGLFALLSLVISVVGIYGVVAFGVSQRGGELAVRMALGAQGADLVRLVLRQTAVAMLAGGALGLGGAVIASRALERFLYGVRPLDPVAFGGTTLLLALAAALASVIPATRAARVDPIAALRSE